MPWESLFQTNAGCLLRVALIGSPHNMLEWVISS